MILKAKNFNSLVKFFVLFFNVKLKFSIQIFFLFFSINNGKISNYAFFIVLFNFNLVLSCAQLKMSVFAGKRTFMIKILVWA